jgi:hypothetical protein
LECLEHGDIIGASWRVYGEGAMRQAVVTVTRVTGKCNAGYQVGDRIMVNLENACIDKDHRHLSAAKTYSKELQL